MKSYVNVNLFFLIPYMIVTFIFGLILQFTMLASDGEYPIVLESLTMLAVTGIPPAIFLFFIVRNYNKTLGEYRNYKAIKYSFYAIYIVYTIQSVMAVIATHIETVSNYG